MRPTRSSFIVLWAGALAALAGCASSGSGSGSGGAPGSGGISGTGGTTGNGGTTSSGGTTGSGGTTATGGTTGSGGVGPIGTGGIGGASPTGAAGATGRGGTAGAAGSSSRGGTTGTGGSATGGTTGSGGVVGTGGTGTGGAGGGSVVSGGPCGLEDCEAVQCTKTFTVPTSAQLKTDAKMPDPFTFFDGTKVTTKADWACRHKEISLLAQAFIYGPKPPKPESLTATYSAGKLTVNVTNAGKSISFSVMITGTGSKPTPAFFGVGESAPGTGMATIVYQPVGEQLAMSNGSQGRITPSGLFYTLYPDYKSTGSLMAWAWGASRIIDALEITTGHNIDLTKLSAIGCSRNGKEAGVIGLFDDRIALVLAKSPGSGLSSGWRVAQAQASGSVQTASEIYGEDTWMGDGFQPFGGSGLNKLPIDQHEVLALAWPRPLIVMEGSADSWNCPVCEYTTLKYTQMVFTALNNMDYVGFPQPNHGHCAQAGTFAIDYQNAFINRFLLGMSSVSTAGLFTENFTFDMAKWQDGTVPTLQ
jgi:hypothetical protein